MQAQPQAEHHWLEKLVGNWTYESECPTGDGPPVILRGTERVRSLGGLWIVAEGEGDMPGGGTARTLLTVGYDTQKKIYVGTWIGSMMTVLWTYEGSMNAAGTELTLAAEGPSFTGEGTAQYRDVITLVNDDERTFTALVQGEGGEWRQMMEMRYRRA